MNLSKKVALALLVAGGYVLAASCASRIDTFLVNELSPKEKAAILFDRCVKTYNEDVIGKGDVSSVARLRADFNEVLDLDPPEYRRRKIYRRARFMGRSTFYALP